MFYLRYLCLFVYSGVSHVLTVWVTWRCLVKGGNCFPFAGVCIFVLFVFVLCLLCPMLPVSMDCMIITCKN